MKLKRVYPTQSGEDCFEMDESPFVLAVEAEKEIKRLKTLIRRLRKTNKEFEWNTPVIYHDSE